MAQRNLLKSLQRFFKDPQKMSSRIDLPTLPKVSNAQPTICALHAFKVAAAVKLNRALGVELDRAYEGIETIKIVVPKKVEGKKVGERKVLDLSVAVARFRLGKPQEVVEKIVKDVRPYSLNIIDRLKVPLQFEPDAYISSVEAEGPFVTFNVNRSTFARLVLDQVNDANVNNRTYGNNDSGNGKHVIIEYSAPNIAKPFHAGHLRSTIIGQVLGNAYEANGWKVTRLNYLGDWGKQYGGSCALHLFQNTVRINNI